MAYELFDELVLIIGCVGFLILVLCFQAYVASKVTNDDLITRTYNFTKDFKIIRNIIFSLWIVLVIYFIFSHITWT